MFYGILFNDILRYIIEHGYKPGDQLPTIQEISQNLGVSVAKTRESLEIARALGLVDIKPGRGTRVESFSFGPAATLSSLYAIGVDQANFAHLRRLRDAIEIGFWDDAVSLLVQADFRRLHQLVTHALKRLNQHPIQTPVQEHRDFHMLIFSRLSNPFVQGILEAYWQSYEAFGLHLYRDLSYHLRVWDYHRRIAEAIETGDIQTGRRLLAEHMNLLNHRQPAALEAADQGPVFE